jgi:hypothetical protein
MEYIFIGMPELDLLGINPNSTLEKLMREEQLPGDDKDDESGSWDESLTQISGTQDGGVFCPRVDKGCAVHAGTKMRQCVHAWTMAALSTQKCKEGH